MIDSSPLALVEFGLDTRIRLWNPAAERIFGWTREEIVGRGGLPMALPEKRAESVTCSRRARGRVGERLRDRAPAQGWSACPGLDRGRPGQGRVRPGGRQHGRVHRHHRAQGAGGGGASAQRRAPRQARGARRVPARIVTVGDVERRRLERNLHDGAQQRLVTLARSLRLALAKLESDPGGARMMLANAGDEPARARRAARARARPSSRGAHRSRAATGGGDARGPRAGRRGDRRDPRRAAAGARRSRRLLPDRRGADQRRQVRRGVDRAGAGRRERCRARRGVRRRRRRRRPGERVGPPRPGRPGRSTERLLDVVSPSGGGTRWPRSSTLSARPRR